MCKLCDKSGVFWTRLEKFGPLGVLFEIPLCIDCAYEDMQKLWSSRGGLQHTLEQVKE